MNTKMVRAIIDPLTELGLVAILGEIALRNEEMRLIVGSVFGAVVMAGVNGRSRRGTGLGSNPPPANPGGGGSPEEEVIVKKRGPMRSKTGFTDAPPDDEPTGMYFAGFPALLSLVLLTLWMGCARPLPPPPAKELQQTEDKKDFKVDINACVKNSETRAEYERCRKDTLKAYGLGDDSGRR